MMQRQPAGSGPAGLEMAELEGEGAAARLSRAAAEPTRRAALLQTGCGGGACRAARCVGGALLALLRAAALLLAAATLAMGREASFRQATLFH